MKVRWMRGSLRLRITPTELQMLLEGKGIEETIGPSGTWQIQVTSAPASALRFEGARVRFQVGQEDLARLEMPDVEGVYFSTEGETPIRYFIEKDFPCVHPRHSEAKEPEAETFTPPADSN